MNIVCEIDEGLFAACCQNGLGTTCETLSGGLVAEMMVNLRSERLDRVLVAETPNKLPSRAIAQVRANAVLKWQDMKAGRAL